MNMKDYFKKYTKNSKKGFTMVELITVIVILSIVSTATVSIFLSVQTTVRDTSTLTTQQYTTTQTEKFIRNEFQTATQVDIHDFEGGKASDFTPKANDEIFYFDSQHKQLVFKQYTSPTTANNKLVIDQVQDVVINICPLDATASGTDTTNMPFKMIYKIKTDSYTYSGGIVMGNCHVSDSNTFGSAFPIYGYSAELHWFMDPKGATNEKMYNPDGNDNDHCITFHSIDSQRNTTSTASTTSTP
ncbi:MAG: type II secretion system protein [Clostridia bacterium]|nr:type II secretion system protein [Clostridia bacterium]